MYKKEKGSLATGTRVLTQSHMGQAVKDLTTDWKVYV